MTDAWTFVAQMLLFYVGVTALGGAVYWNSKRMTREYDRQQAERGEPTS